MFRRAFATTLAAGALCVTVALPQSALAVPKAGAVTFTPLKLEIGWKTYPGYASPAVADIGGIITLRGAMVRTTGGSYAFRLPKAFRPSRTVFVTSPLCGRTEGQLYISPTGGVLAEFAGRVLKAGCIESLDGVSFAKSGESFTKLSLQNGWLNSPDRTSPAAARVISGVVHLKGAIYTRGTNPLAFTLPAAFRPAAVVDVPVNLYGGNKGRLRILPNGQVRVSAENKFSFAKRFTALDGVTFATSAASFRKLKTQNGWQPYGHGAYRPAARVTSGIVQFEGAVSTSITNDSLILLTLPKSMRPKTPQFLEVDLCGANNGRLVIQTNGAVIVHAEGGNVDHATCMTSLDGAWFAR